MSVQNFDILQKSGITNFWTNHNGQTTMANILIFDQKLLFWSQLRFRTISDSEKVENSENSARFTIIGRSILIHNLFRAICTQKIIWNFYPVYIGSISKHTDYFFVKRVHILLKEYVLRVEYVQKLICMIGPRFSTYENGFLEKKNRKCYTFFHFFD